MGRAGLHGDGVEHGTGCVEAAVTVARTMGVAAVLATALLSFHVSRKVKNRWEDPCRHCHYAAFHRGERLLLETKDGLDFATRADAARYEKDYGRTADITAAPPVR